MLAACKGWKTLAIEHLLQVSKVLARLRGHAERVNCIQWLPLHGELLSIIFVTSDTELASATLAVLLYPCTNLDPTFSTL